MYAAVCDTLQCEVMCVVDLDCNHLLAVDMDGVACRGLWYTSVCLFICLSI